MKKSVPDPRLAGRFHFESCAYDPISGEAHLAYRFDQGPELIEKIRFPHSPWPPEASRQAAFGQALRILHAIAGVSYYKAGLSPELDFAGQSPDPKLAGFLNDLYTQGLGEFAYVNGLDVRGRVRFPDTEPASSPHDLLLPDRALVAMGGGKDSLVGLNLLQEAGIEVLPICVGQSPLIGDTVKAAGLPLLRIERSLAPELAAMNRAGAWNGHVPVTAINSAILVCAAILYGFAYVVFSNERSADEATLELPDGSPVNHQYSKSSAFEQSFRDVIASHISPDIEYFSILRPYSELDIVRRFSTMKEFHPVYSSCNRNFHIDGSRIEGRWCLDCPKCRFAALSLALFLSPAEVKEIMGGDLLAQAGQLEGFRALCGLGQDKPFECVGEAGESRAAMAALAVDDRWSQHAVVRMVALDLEGVTVPGMDELLMPATRHFIPAPILSALAGQGSPDGGEDLAHQKIGILGIGREGQAARDYLRTACPGIELALISEDPPDAGFAARLTERDKLVIGPLSEAQLEAYDLLIRSPGISIYREALVRAKSAGVEISTPSNLWFGSHPHEKTICITGTKGKSTTSALIAHLLRACGYRVRLAGNIGLPLLSCEDQDVDWWVIELSSYQLADLEARPDLAVILNVSADHLDWHGGVEAYQQDKLRLAHLAVEAPVIANAADPILAQVLSSRPHMVWFNSEAGFHVQAGRILDGQTELAVSMPESMPGLHNLSNSAAALAVLRSVGADMETAVSAISSFKSLPHRLQLVGERADVRFFNDSISSSPLATAAALQALAGNTISLIVGGYERGIDWTPYMESFRSCPAAAVIAIPDNGSRILDTLRQAELNPENGAHLVANLQEAVNLAVELTPAGGLVLLSPGAPSFPQFRDYRDRGRKFASLCGFELEEWDIQQSECQSTLEK